MHCMLGHEFSRNVLHFETNTERMRNYNKHEVSFSYFHSAIILI